MPPIAADRSLWAVGRLGLAGSVLSRSRDHTWPAARSSGGSIHRWAAPAWRSSTPESWRSRSPGSRWVGSRSHHARSRIVGARWCLPLFLSRAALQPGRLQLPRPGDDRAPGAGSIPRRAGGVGAAWPGARPERSLPVLAPHDRPLRAAVPVDRELVQRRRSTVVGCSCSGCLSCWGSRCSRCSCHDSPVHSAPIPAAPRGSCCSVRSCCSSWWLPRTTIF